MMFPYEILLKIVCSRTLSLLTTDIMRMELSTYISRGRLIRETAVIPEIAESMLKEIMETDALHHPKTFYFVGQGSGVGKTQLAWSLPVPVVYLPWTNLQTISQCFQSHSNMVHSDVTADADAFYIDFRGDAMYAQTLNGIPYKLRTVGLLLTLFKEVLGKSNEESMRMLSGYDGERVITYQPMSIQEARIEIEEMVVHHRSAYNQETDELLIPVFYIDECIPKKKKNCKDYNYGLFLRNIIRCMGCVCVQSGSDDDLLFITDELRDDHVKGAHILRLIARLPPTELDIFRRDSKYADLIPRLSFEVCEMLKSTTPLYALCVLDALLEIRHQAFTSRPDEGSCIGHLSASVLSKAKEMLLRDKGRYARNGGLSPLMSMLTRKVSCFNLEEIEMEMDESDDGSEEDAGSKMQECKDDDQASERKQVKAQFTVHHILGKMPNTESRNAILPLRMYDDFVCVGVADVNDDDDDNDVNDDDDDDDETEYEPFRLFRGNDALSYFMCARDGNYFEKKIDNGPTEIIRLSATRGLRMECFNRLFPFFLTQGQDNLELEVLQAAIITCHSFPDSLSDCPLDYFLRSLIAELNVFQNHVILDAIDGMPPAYSDVRVRLLYPGDVLLDEKNVSIHTIENNSVCTCIWKSNFCRIFGVYPMLLSTIKRNNEISGSRNRSNDMNVPTKEFVQSIYDTVENKHAITLLVCTKLGAISADDDAFIHAEVAIDVFEITGNASQDQKVATELRWKPIQIEQQKEVQVDQRHTVIVIELETIYYKRFKIMGRAYA